MMNSTSIHKVRTRKMNPKLFIDGINYGRVIATQTYNVSYKSIIKELVRLFIFNCKVEIEGNKSSNICFFYSFKSSNRKDLDSIADLFKESIKDIKYIHFIRYISLKNLFEKIYMFSKYFREFLMQGVEDSCISAIVVTQYLMQKNYIDQFKIFDDELTIFITFCDAHGIDNLLTQIANRKQIKTITLQHGQYRILSDGNEIADAELYENFISDYMLVWGQATVDEFIRVGIDADRLIKVGALKAFSFNKNSCKYEINSTFGVVLSGDPYKETNINMIKLANQIAEKHNLKYFVRFHPRNQRDLYLKYCKEEYLTGSSSNIENSEYAKIVDFSLIHMTGVFVELLSVNSLIIVYKDKFIEKIFEIDPYCIQDIKEFDELYKLFLTNKNQILEDQLNKYKYFNEPGNVLANYKLAIEKICGKEFI